MLQRIFIIIALALTSPLAAEEYWQVEDGYLELLEIAQGAGEGYDLLVDARGYRLPADTIFIERRPLNPYLAIKTNLLYDAAMVPNLAAEFYLGGDYSLSVGWFGAWWSSDARHRYWRIYGGEITARRYFGWRSRVKPLTAHHIGVSGAIGTYDFEWGSTGYLSKLSYMFGVEYGYALPIARRLNLDFVVGVGYLGGEYDIYEPNGECYCWQERRRRNYFGVTKAEIALVWLIGRDNYNRRGGIR